MPMEKLRQTTQRILDILDSEDWSKTDEFDQLTTAYAEACKQLNGRLEMCLKQLMQGDIDNAVNTWKENPPIPQAVKLLNFNRRAEWDELCDLYQLPQAPQIREERFLQLKEKLEEHKDIEPLLKKYRGKVHRGSTEEKLSLLRQIYKKSPEKTVWEKELVKLEKQRLREITASTKDAILNENRKTLDALHRELIDPQWKVSPDKTVLTKIEAKRAEFHKADLRKRADALLKEIAIAYSEFDLNNVLNLLNQWDKLVEDPLFSPVENDKTQIKDAREWADEESHRIRREEKCDKLFKLFTKAIDEHAFELAQKHKTQLENEDYEIPEHILNRFRSLEEEDKLARDRAFKQRILIAVCLLLLLGVGAWIGVNAYVNQRKIDKYVSEVSNHLTQGKLGTAENILAELKSDNPKTSDDPDVIRVVNELARKKAIEEKRKKRLRKSFADLETMQNSNFPDEEAAGKVFIRAEKIVKTPEEQARLNEIKVVYDSIKNERQTKRDREFLDKSEQVLRFVRNDLLSKNPADNFKAYNARLAELTQQAEEIYSAEKISAPLKREQSKILRKMISNAASRYQEARSRVEKMHTMLADIWTNTVPLEKYEKRIELFLQEFVAEEKAVGFQQVIKLMPYFKGAAVLKNFSPYSADKSQIIKFRNRLDNYPHSVWLEDYKLYATWMLKLIENTEKVKEGVKKLKDAPVFSDDCSKLYRYRFANRKGFVAAYIIQLFENKSRDEHFRYYGYEVEDRTMELPGIKNHAVRQFIGSGEGYSWSVIQGYEGEPATGDRNLKCVLHGDNFSPVQIEHAAIADRIALHVAEADAEELELVLLDELNFLVNTDKMALRVKLITIRHLLTLLRDIAGEEGAEYYTSYIDDIDEFAEVLGERDWVKAEIDKDKASHIMVFLDRLPDFYKKRYRECCKRLVLQVALNRLVHPVGVVKADYELEFTSDLFSNMADEIWILDVDHDESSARFKIVGRDGKIDPRFRSLLFKGQPIFSPLDGRSTADLAEKLQNKYLFLEQKANWPRAWPVNAR